MTAETSGTTSTTEQNRGGLEGVVAATTVLSKVEGTTGRLIYRGYNIHDLARSTSFEEIAYLLWYGKLPTKMELVDLKVQMLEERTSPTEVLQVLNDLPSTIAPMDALRTAVSAWGAMTVEGKPGIDQAIALTVRFPVFLAAFHRLRNGLEPLESHPELDYAANYLYLLSGQIPKEEHVKALNAYLVLLADHGMNASTFTARVVASTECTQDRAEGWLRDALARGERLMGFGHRVYKTEDPRAEELRELARLADPQAFALARRVEELALALLQEQKPGRHLYTNVEFYSAVLLASVGLPGDLFTPTFAASRVSGWTAHILEQINNNRLIRPEAEYTGPTEMHFVPLGER